MDCFNWSQPPAVFLVGGGVDYMLFCAIMIVILIWDI